MAAVAKNLNDFAAVDREFVATVVVVVVVAAAAAAAVASLSFSVLRDLWQP